MTVYSRKELETIRFRKTRAQIKYVYERSEFYKRKFDHANVKPEDVNSLSDYAKKIPFTTKEELRTIQSEKHPLGTNLCIPYNQVTLLVSSTGTTGKSTFIAANQHDWGVWMECLKRSFRLSGFRPGDVYLHALAMSTYISGLSYASAARELGMAAITVGVPTPASRILGLIRDCSANVMVCTPSYAEHLAEKVKETLGIEPPEVGLRKIGCSGEPGAGIESIRKKLENLWNADVRDRMGTPEIMPGNRSECSNKNGMHNLALEHVYDELVDPETKEIIEPLDGAEGAIVYSAIDAEAYPLLRFYVNDQVKVCTADCPCGYPDFTISVIGRYDDMIKVKGIKIWPTAIKDVILSFLPDVTGEFRFIVEEMAGFSARGELKLVIECGSTVDQSEYAPLSEAIAERIREQLYFTPNIVEIVPSGALQRAEFKAKYLEVRRRISI